MPEMKKSKINLKFLSTFYFCRHLNSLLKQFFILFLCNFPVRISRSSSVGMYILPQEDTCAHIASAALSCVVHELMRVDSALRLYKCSTATSEKVASRVSQEKNYLLRSNHR